MLSFIRSGLSQKKYLLAAVIVGALLIAAGLGATVRYLQTRTDEAKNKLPTSVSRSQDLLAQGKTDQAEAAVKEALDRPSTTPEERHLLYVQQGRIAFSKGDYKAAATSYTSAWGVKQTYEVARKLGSTWQELGDNRKAIDFYKKALLLNPPDNPLRESESRTLQQMIDMLESEGQA